jgi:hypothetical protein
MNAIETTACSPLTTLMPVVLHAGLDAARPDWLASAELPPLGPLPKVVQLSLEAHVTTPAPLPKSTQLPNEWTEVELLARMMGRESRAPGASSTPATTGSSTAPSTR